jgi:RNA polymerase sigma-70 factor (ECF subfamily)
VTEHQTASAFESTSWSLVLSASGNPALLEQLLRAYWGPIYAYIRRSGRSRDQAAELTQEFIAQAVLERDLIQKADPQRGRFRTYLKTALRNFLVDQHRRATAKGRAPDGFILDSDALAQFEPADTDDPTRAFERLWATAVLSRTLARLEADCMACGQAQHWSAFRLAVIEPSIGLGFGSASPSDARTSPSLDEVAREIGAPGAEQVSSMIQTLRRKFRRMLVQVVGETLENPADAPDEVARIQEALSP